jgi:hypothetical protein
VDCRVLETGPDRRHWFAAERPPQGPIQGDAHEGHNLRTELVDLLFQDLPALEVFRRPQIVDAGAGTGHHIRDAEAPLRQSRVVGVPDRLGHQAGLVEQLPESVRRAGEVVTGLRGSHPGIDPDQQHADTGRDPIRQSQVPPIRFRIVAHSRSGSAT